MLFKLIYLFHSDFSWLNVFRYITFRTILSSLTGLTLCFIVGAWGIRKLRSLQIGERIREDGPPNHQAKAGTPTMGGCLILPAIVLATLLWADPFNRYIQLATFVVLFFGAIGFVDDYSKVTGKNPKGHGCINQVYASDHGCPGGDADALFFTGIRCHTQCSVFEKHRT